MLAHEHTVPGLSDGGAHVGTICDASFPTTLLSLWGRDRAEGRLPLAVPRAAAHATRPALVGLLDRGVLAPGYRGDCNLIDFERLQARRPEMHHDLPAGGRRLLQRADGYVATVKAGQVTYERGEATDALPGRLLRGARSAHLTDHPRSGVVSRRQTSQNNARPFRSSGTRPAWRRRPSARCPSSSDSSSTIRRPRPLDVLRVRESHAGQVARSWSTTADGDAPVRSRSTVSSKGVAAWRTALVTSSLTSSSTVSVSPVKSRIGQRPSDDDGALGHAGRTGLEVLVPVDVGNGTASPPHHRALPLRSNSRRSGHARVP